MTTTVADPNASVTGRSFWARGRPIAGMGNLLPDLMRTTRLYGQAVPGALPVLIAFIVLGAAVTIATPYTAKKIIDAVGAVQHHRTTQVMLPWLWLAAEGVLTGLGQFALLGEARTTETLRHRGRVHLLTALLERACGVRYARFEDQAFTNRLTQAWEDAPNRPLDFLLQVLSVLRHGLIFIGSLALVSMSTAWALPIIVISALPQFLRNLRMAVRDFAVEQQHSNRHRRSSYVHSLLTDEIAAKEIRALAAGHWLVGIFRGLLSPHAEARVGLARAHHKSGLLVSAFSLPILYGPYMYVVWGAIQGRLTIGDMLLFVVAFRQGSVSLTRMLVGVSKSFEQQFHVRSILEILDYPDEEQESPPDECRVVDSAPELVLDDIWFTYPKGDRPVLRGLHLRVQAGEMLAVVAPNGMGKTTMIKLLLGLYSPDRGRLMLAGNDLAQRSSAWRRDNIGVVFQDFCRFAFDVTYNVGSGWCSRADDTVAVADALRKAKATRIVEGLPKGINSALGAAFGGRDLSGGEWQRIALARLCMRKSRVWILDEPTAAMDSQAEEDTLHTLRAAAVGRTVVFVTHRISTARLADRIAVFDEGRVAELGTHEQLMDQNGRYAALFRRQARAYRVPGGATDSGQGPTGLDCLDDSVLLSSRPADSY
jgi:ATP-binding cassette subfamily B protein